MQSMNIIFFIKQLMYKKVDSVDTLHLAQTTFLVLWFVIECNKNAFFIFHLKIFILRYFIIRYDN